ncbi:Glycine-rich RNA-binding protein 3, mitochondrial-like protein [Drosera capensis]
MSAYHDLNPRTNQGFRSIDYTALCSPLRRRNPFLLRIAMAFLSKVRNMLTRSATKQIVGDLSTSNPPMFQAVRWISSKVFVGGLSYGIDDDGLKQAFSQYGQVIDAKVVFDRETNRSRGFGFVTFTSSEEASSAILALDGQDLDGRRVRVSYATEKARPSFGGGGGGYGPGGGGYGNVGGGYGASGDYSSIGGGGYSSGDISGGYNSTGVDYGDDKYGSSTSYFGKVGYGASKGGYGDGAYGGGRANSGDADARGSGTAYAGGNDGGSFNGGVPGSYGAGRVENTVTNIGDFGVSNSRNNDDNFSASSSNYGSFSR